MIFAIWSYLILATLYKCILNKFVIFHSAESIFNIPLINPATLHYDSTIKWEGPVIFRSSCHIDVADFPFDEQNCSLKLGSWTYNANQVDMVTN